MKTFNQQPDNLVLLVLRLSIFFLLSLNIINSLRVAARPMIPAKEGGSVSQFRQKVREIYTSQIGIREKPSNSGEAVEKYLAYVNLPKGNPWCAAFVCWVYGRAGVENPRSGWSPDLFGEGRVIWGRRVSSIKNQESRFPQSEDITYNIDGGSNSPAWQPAYRTGRLATGNWQSSKHDSQPSTFQSKLLIPKSGDVFGLYFPEKGRIAHVGFIDQWDGKWLITVEGNTNEAGSREGDGVYRKKRLVRTVYKVARYVD